jgi:hypothetical protein
MHCFYTTKMITFFISKILSLATIFWIRIEYIFEKKKEYVSGRRGDR